MCVYDMVSHRICLTAQNRYDYCCEVQWDAYPVYLELLTQKMPSPSPSNLIPISLEIHAMAHLWVVSECREWARSEGWGREIVKVSGERRQREVEERGGRKDKERERLGWMEHHASACLQIAFPQYPARNYVRCCHTYTRKRIQENRTVFDSVREAV